MDKTQKKTSKKSNVKRFATIGLWFGLSAFISLGLALVIKLSLLSWIHNVSATL